VLSRIPILRALGQKPSQVVVLHPGARFLSAPLPIAPYAIRHRDFAWLSLAAYSTTPAAQKQAAKAARRQRAGIAPRVPVLPARDPIAALETTGWARWPRFGDPAIWDQIDAAHLRVEVWENTAQGALAVAFGGTVLNNRQDWLSNLRWFIPHHRDEYTQVVHVFAQLFRGEYQRRYPAAARPALFSAGHSLGGGLAQQFAYALPPDGGVPRVKEVYAFDPSPVTGYFSVSRRLRNANKRGLSIDRIYERGEILALVRSLISLVYRPSRRDPAIGGVRYSLFHGWNPIADHSMAQLANKIDRAADH
jgi:hypothetical protein